MAEKYKDSGDGGFSQFLWNSNTGEFCGRTGASWAKILIFYLIFYACLAAFWAVMLLIFYQTIDPTSPKWQLSESRIGINPGLGFRPRPPVEKIESTLIWFSGTGKDDGSWKHWGQDLEKYLEPYNKESKEGTGEHTMSLDECNTGRDPGVGKYCPFVAHEKANQTGTHGCNKENYYGYKEGKPCVLIKLNRIYGWKPEAFGNDEIPDEVKGVVSSTKGSYEGGVYIVCEGENPADKENIGEMTYYPNQVIRSNYFPFTNQPGYLSPYVMVKFSSPATGVLINIECKAWAKNIKHDRQDREGSVHFELLID
jgi:sodium/potassium-transporting ATPase subunit beta